MIQTIAGDKEFLKYTWPKRPGMLRYRAQMVAPAFYSAGKFTTTDYKTGITVLYQKDRDRGCFEVIRAAGVSGVVGLPVYKKFYIDYEPWLSQDPGSIDVVAMCLDDNYQTLFLLFRQQRKNVSRIGLWLARINIAQEKFELPTDLNGIPMFEFLNKSTIQDIRITQLSDRLDWLCSRNWEHADIVGSTATNNMYNLIVTNGKIFVTVPVISDFAMPVPDDTKWSGTMVPALVQALFMYDKRTGLIEGSGIIGVVSSYTEEFYSPSPNNWPVRPAKIGANIVEDCIVWYLSPMHTLPADIYEEHIHYYRGASAKNDAKRAFLPTLINRADAWKGTHLPDDYYQLHRSEAVGINELIDEIKSSSNRKPLQPVLYKARHQFYIQNPLVFDLSGGAVVNKVWQSASVNWSRGIVTYGMCYHNFHRKVIKNIAGGSVPVYSVIDHEVGDFVYTGAGEILGIDGETKYYHIFGLENLSCDTYMTDVKLKAPAGSTLRFGRMAGAPSKPNLTEITWESIAPHTEALFTVYASSNTVNRKDVYLEYGLEML